MTYSTLTKVSLTTLALVGAFAVSANANGPRDLLRMASQTHGTHANHGKLPFHIQALDSTYMIDDGTAEDAVGLTAGGDIIELNEFAVIPGSETITSVSIAFGTPLFPDPSLNGLSYTVLVYSDPNGDGNPNDAVLLTTAPGTVSAQGTDTFITTTITPTTITTPNFFVGCEINDTVAGQFPAAFDETPPTLSNRSYIAGGANGDINNLNNNDLPVAPIESFGLIGNWLVRADATGSGGGDLTLDSAASRRIQGGQAFDIDLPLTGTPAVEPRGGAAEFVVFTFSNTISSVDSATATCGTVSTIQVSGNTVEIKGVGSCDQQNVTVTLNGVHDDQGNTLDSASATVGLLFGDVNGDHIVNLADVNEIRSHARQPVDSSNFKDDINLSGVVDPGDVRLAKANKGDRLP